MNVRNGESGFTIIELLVVMTTLGILAGIMSSVFTEYKKRSYNTSAMTDLRNSLISLQTYIDDNESYPTCVDDACETMDGFKRTPGVKITFTQTSGRDGVAVACFPQRGDMRYVKSTLANLIIQLPGTTC